MERMRIVAQTKKDTWQHVWTAGMVGYSAARQDHEDPAGARESAPGIYALLCVVMGFEGFVHSVGASVCPKHWWAAVERSSVKRKLELIAEEVPFALDFGLEPFSHWRRLKSFRDAIAHPRITEASGEFYTYNDDWPIRVSSEILVPWEEECRMPQLATNIDALEAMRSELIARTGIELGPMSQGRGTETLE